MSGDQLLLEGAKIAIPLAISNHRNIINKLRSWRRVKTNGQSVDVSVYLTLFADFKTDYSIEDVNEYICQVLRKYKTNAHDRSYKYGETQFAIYIEYNYSDRFYAPVEDLDFDFHKDEDDEIIMLPSVNGISMYFIPESGAAKTELMDGYKLADFIQNELLKKYDVKSTKAFMYVESQTKEDLDKIKSVLQKKAAEWNAHIKDLSYKKKELKLKADPLTAKMLGEIL